MPAATVIKPVVGLRVIEPAAGAVNVPTVIDALVPSTIGVPLVLSFAVTEVVVTPPVAGIVPAGIKLAAGSFTAKIVGAIATTTDPEQAGAVPVHKGSPPPVTVAVLFPPVAPTTAVLPTVMGTVTVIGATELAGIMQLDRLVQLPSVAPLTSNAPLAVIPRGKVSASVIAAVVGPFATLIVMM